VTRSGCAALAAFAVACTGPAGSDGGAGGNGGAAGGGGGADASGGGGGNDAGDRQQTYGYPACDAGTIGCPNDLAFFCALNAIRDKYRSCADAGDCVRPVVSNCVAWGECLPEAVNRAALQSFHAEAGVEVSRYCGPFPYSGCNESPSCATSYAAGAVDCVSGQCVGRSDDGGP